MADETTDADPMSDVVRRAVQRDPTIDITTTGRRTGTPRRIEIWMTAIDDRFYILGTPGPRDWLANLRVNSGLVVHLKEDPPVDVDAQATEVTDEPTRRHVFEHVTAHWYRTQTSVDDLVAHAPIVEVTFSQGG